MPEKKYTSAQRALRRLRGRKVGALAGALAGGALESPRAESPNLGDQRIKSSLDIARERFRMIAERAEYGSQLSDEQKKVLADAEAALKKLAHDGETADVTGDQQIALEAIVVADGTRPALFVKDDDVDAGVAEAGTWATSIATLQSSISTVAPSVGRINSKIGAPNYAGTGFVVADGLILTNRHVLEALVGGPNPQPDGTWKFLKPVTIDFVAEFGNTQKKEFEVTGVAFAGPDAINHTVVLSHLDVALLKVKTNNAAGDSFPAPLALSKKLDPLAADSNLYVMGYPARPLNEVAEVLMKVFLDEYFVKRFAPGLVERALDDVDDGGLKRVFTHDASTLGGNSGSCVVEFTMDGRAVVGLHFGGVARSENFSHAVAKFEQVLNANGVTLQNV